jgi:hypothetical protein
MPNTRTPGKWPYRAGQPVRTRRVIKTRPEGAPQGAVRREPPPPRVAISRLQARLVLAAAMLALIVTGGWYAYHSPWLTVQHVSVTGTATLTESQVRAVAGLDRESIFGLDLTSAKARVAALPGVRGVTVTKHGWSNVSIAVDERTVWGSWQINGVDVPIDADGYVLDGVTAPPGAPVIVEVEPQRVINSGDQLDSGAVQLAARLVRDSQKSFGRDVKALVYRQSSGLTAVLSGSDVDSAAMWVTFGDSRDYDYKVAALYVLIEQAGQNDLVLNTVDLRFGDRLSFN